MAFEVATATVSIVPNMKGAQQKISKELGAGGDKAGETAGKSIGSSLVGSVKGIVGAAAIGKFIGESLKAGADLQQSLGGIETMFKENADTVKGYASEAYRTAGISANEYMENVTSFSAALISSMDGDTAAAAELANTAMIDMADNANKMGSDMASIQAAYQGFAKGQYQLLDNLKLGYGGTKTEMERLLADATKLSGVEYNIDNLDDVYEAIHVIQEDLGITGTTAQEAASTFSGSFASMKAAATDLMGNLSLGNDITPQVQALGSTIQTFVTGNLLPMVSNIVQQLPTIIGQLPGFFAEMIPQIIPMAGQMLAGLAHGLIANIPVLVGGIGECIASIVDTFLNTDWLAVGTDIVNMIDEGWAALTDAAIALWGTVVDTFTQVIETVPILSDAWNAITDVASTLWEAVTTTFTSIISTVPILSDAWDAITETAQTIWDAVVGFFTGEISVSDVVTGAWDVISTTAQTIWDTVTGIFTGEISVVDILTGAWDAITGIAQTIWDTIVGIFTGEISVVDILTGAWDLLTAPAQVAFDAAAAIFGGEIDVKEIVTTAWDGLLGVAKGIWDGAKAVFEDTAPAVKAVATKAWNSLGGTARKIWNGAKKIFEGAAPAVKTVSLAAWGTIANTAETLFNAAKGKFESVAPAVKAVVTTAWDNLTTTAGDIWDAVKEVFTNFDITWPDFGQLASSAFEGLKSAAKSAWDWVKGLFGGGADDETVAAVQGSTTEMEAALRECNLVVSEVDTSSIDTANDTVKTATEGWETEVSGVDLTLPAVDTASMTTATTAVSTAVSQMKASMNYTWSLPSVNTSGLSTAVSAVNGAVSQMKSAMNFSWSLPKLHGTLPVISVSMKEASSSDGKTKVSYPDFSVGTKWFAKGAVFTQPTIIGVGEAGAEAALPLDTFWRRLDAEFDKSRSGATINNYIEVNGATDPVAYADELARELQLQLKRA